MQIYSIYDEKALAYNIPFILQTDGLATRAFADLINDDRSTIHNYPSDFTLYRIGTVDLSTGTITPEPKPVYIIKASNLLNINEN